MIKELFKQGMMVTINQVLDRDTATLVVEEMGHTAVTPMNARPNTLIDRGGNLLARPCHARRW